MARRSRDHAGLVVQGSRDWLVLLPGFQTPAVAYRDLANRLAMLGPTVYVPQVLTPGPRLLFGGPDVKTEAVRAAALTAAVRRNHRPRSLVLAGHSRGGLAAWLAAGHIELDGLALIDPVDASGPRPRGQHHTLTPLAVPYQTLVIGAGITGPCAPKAVNHAAFAAATPGCRHVVLPDLGHADILSGRWRDVGRRLCRGGSDPATSVCEIARLLATTVRV